MKLNGLITSSARRRRIATFIKALLYYDIKLLHVFESRCSGLGRGAVLW